MPYESTDDNLVPTWKKENIAGYNCFYIPVDHPKAFDEILYAYVWDGSWFQC